VEQPVVFSQEGLQHLLQVIVLCGNERDRNVHPRVVLRDLLLASESSGSHKLFLVINRTKEVVTFL
jgi:hypothetical protein